MPEIARSELNEMAVEIIGDTVNKLQNFHRKTSSFFYLMFCFRLAEAISCELLEAFFLTCKNKTTNRNDMERISFKKKTTYVW